MHWLLWTNILMASGAAGWVIVTMDVLELPLDPILVILAFTLALAFYTRDRLNENERKADLLSIPARTVWIEQHTKFLKLIMRGSFLSAVILIAIRPLATFPLLSGLGFALSYTVRWFPWHGQWLGWKHLPGIKMPFVAILWSLTTVITPATVYGKLWQSSTWFVAFAVCVLIMIQILLNDLRDVVGDRINHTISLPVLLGETAARRVGYLLALISIVLAVPIASISIMLTVLYSIFLIWHYHRKDDAYWRFWIEIQGIVAGLATLVKI